MCKIFFDEYLSPIGQIEIICTDYALLSLQFTEHIEEKTIRGNKISEITKTWLDEYFKGKNPKFTITLQPQGTNFQKEVWNIIKAIPYGESLSYKEIASQIAIKHKKEKMSAQAVGCAIGKNPILLIIPCHRVIGSNKKLVGYAGGLQRKEYLLKLEQINYHL